jgi:hypothetical protein
MRRFACFETVRGLYGHKSGPQGVMPPARFDPLGSKLRVT